MTIKFEAKTRDVHGKGASRRLRHAGRVPGVVYGSNQAPVSLDIDHNEVFQCARKEAFHASVLTMVLDGQPQPVLLRDIQVHPYKPKILHLDFQRVDANEKLHIKVPFHFINADQAPGVKLGGGTVSQILTEAEVSCLPANLPEFIEVDLSGLNAGQSVHLSEVKLPAGVELVALGRGEDLAVVAIIGAKGGDAS